MTHRIKSRIKNTSLCLSVLLIIGCNGYSIIKKQEVPDIPIARYERIIRLDNPEGSPERTLAGVVHVTGRATVCTDYPREETIKSLDDLTEMEKLAFPYFLNYAIRDGEELLGFVSIPVGYRVTLWRNEKDQKCKYKVQIILPERTMGHAEQTGTDKSVTNW